jgi:hypothetical protein
VSAPSPIRLRPPLGGLVGGAIGLLAAAVGLVGLGRASALRAGWPAEADTMYLPDSRTLRALSLGHTELAADLVAARANVYFGSQIVAKAPQRHLTKYVNTAADLDPWFHRIYLSGAAMLIYNGREMTVDAILAACALLERGEERFPQDWEITFQLGFNKFYELPKLAGEGDPRVATWRQEGLEAMRRATLFDGVPFWLPNLVARLLTKEGSQELAIRHLEQAYAATSSAETREQIRGKLLQLHGEQLATRMEEERAAFERRLSESYPYVPEAFAIIAGPRRPFSIELPTSPTP